MTLQNEARAYGFQPGCTFFGDDSRMDHLSKDCFICNMEVIQMTDQDFVEVMILLCQIIKWMGRLIKEVRKLWPKIVWLRREKDIRRSESRQAQKHRKSL